MSEAKDPAIKLFGTTINLPEIIPSAPDLVDYSARSTHAAIVPDTTTFCSSTSLAQGREFNTSAGSEAEQDSHKEPLEGRNEDGTVEDEPVMSSEVNGSNGMKENSKSLSVDDMSVSTKAEEQNESSESQDKTLKKPDKILPCPRCNSMDTKFCYYNNYNVNQPRHFCRNCHRYWTAGGTMRNVPVGAGRRKNKCPASQGYLPSGIHSSLKPNDSSLASCSETPLCESTASVVNIADKAVCDITRNGFHGPEGHIISNPYGITSNAEYPSGGSSTTEVSSKDETGNDRFAVNLVPDNRTFPHQMACFPGAPWPYPWNTLQVNSPVPPTAYTSAGFSAPYYSAPTYWACTMPGAWNIPWLNSLPPASQNDCNPLGGPSSSTLGKRSRDDSLMKDEPLKENDPEKNLWVPKTLRIMDPEEAAKSSIWSTLGIRNNQVDPAVGGGLFKAFQSKGGAKTKILETSPLLQANPAALSRSLTFQESS